MFQIKKVVKGLSDVRKRGHYSLVACNVEAGMKHSQWPCRMTGDQFQVVIDGVKLNVCI
jgi:hypothetical protein